MKKLLLTFTLIFSGCKSVDDQGRLEKVRIAVPAFFQIEMDYYKDKLEKPLDYPNSQYNFFGGNNWVTWLKQA